jgi:hypothetical protein
MEDAFREIKIDGDVVLVILEILGRAPKGGRDAGP